MSQKLNPSPKVPTGTYPELSPNPKSEEGFINGTNEQPNTQLVNPGQVQQPTNLTLAKIIELVKKYGGDKSRASFIVTNIKELTDEQCDSLEVGNSVAKQTGNQYHIYFVTYKENRTGLCLTYLDATVVETVSYDYTVGHWVYNSTDIGGDRNLDEKVDEIIDRSLLNGELKRVLQNKTFSVSDFPLTSDIDSQHATVNEGLLPNGDMSGLTESQINRIVLTLNRIINKGWLKVSTLRAIKLTSVMYDATIISIVASTIVFGTSEILSGKSYLITLDISNSSYSYAEGSYN